MKRRTKLAALATVFLLVAAVVFLRPQLTHTESTSVEAVEKTTPEAQKQAQVAEYSAIIQKATRDLQVAREIKESIAKNRSVEITYSFAGSVALMVKNHNPLGLTPEQVSLIQASYDQLYEKRSSLEARIAKVDTVSPNGRLITIPAYKVEREKLFHEFVADLANKLGTKISDGFVAEYANTVLNQNAGFGEREQELLVTAVDGNTYKIVHTVSRSDVSGNGAVTQTKVWDLQKGHLDSYTKLAAYFP